MFDSPMLHQSIAGLFALLSQACRRFSRQARIGSSRSWKRLHSILENTNSVPVSSKQFVAGMAAHWTQSESYASWKARARISFRSGQVLGKGSRAE
jgi:hypothetical protein